MVDEIEPHRHRTDECAHYISYLVSSLAVFSAAFFITSCRECVNDDGEIDREKCTEICSEKTSQGSCDDITFSNPTGGADWSHGCAWAQFHETEINEDGVCSYGDMVGKCLYYSRSEGGCDYGLFCEDNTEDSGSEGEMDYDDPIAFYEKDDRIFMMSENLCVAGHTDMKLQWCEWEYHNDMGNEYYTLESPPECTCPCNDDFPGWL